MPGKKSENGRKGAFFFEKGAADVRKRYIEKISKIDFIDPYLLKPTDLNYDSDVLPLDSYPDIVNYLLFAPSPMTGEQLKCYKSMDAYNYYLSGFVKKSWY